MNKKIVALIGARAGSKGVPNKNLRSIGNYPLITYSLAAAQMSKYITETVFSSDSSIMLHTAMEYNPSVIPIHRPNELASDTATDLEWIEDVCKQLQKKNNLPDLLVHLRPTTPLRGIHVIDAAISCMLQCPDVTSLRSAHKLGESPYKMFVKSEHRWKPFMQMEKSEFYNLPRQAFPQVYHPNGYVDILRTKHILEKHNLHGDNILAYETEKVIEIDSLDDLEEADSKYTENMIWKYMARLA